MRTVPRFTILVIVFFFVTTKQDALAQWKIPSTAQEVDKCITSISDSITKYSGIWGTQLKNREFGKLKKTKNKSIYFVDEGIKTIKKISGVANSEKYCAVSIQGLTRERKLILDNFTPFETLSKNYSEEKYNKYLADLTQRFQDETEFSKTLDAAQKDYREQNHLKVDEK